MKMERAGCYIQGVTDLRSSCPGNNYPGAKFPIEKGLIGTCLYQGLNFWEEKQGE